MEGGAVITEDEQIAEMIRVLRNYGSEKRYHNKVIGTNSRLDELQAGLLRVRLSHMEEITQEREKLAERYTKGLDDPGIILPESRIGTRFGMASVCDQIQGTGCVAGILEAEWNRDDGTLSNSASFSGSISLSWTSTGYITVH